MAQQLAYREIESESDLRAILDELYAITKQALENNLLPKFKGLLELAKSEITIITAITAEGRKTYFERTMKQRRLPRDDITMSLSLYKYEGQTNGIYNFEFLMNRAYAFNRDKGRCRICGGIIIGDELVTHHINPNLPFYRVNKVPNLASTHQACHNLIHSDHDTKHLGSKIKSKILRFREKLK